MTAGSFMAKIRARGYLIAGVDQSTYHFGYLNPLDGQIEGFDIDMIRAVAKAIFGNPDKVEYKAISDAERIPDITDGSVDIVAHTMTITCARLAAGGLLQRLLRRPTSGSWSPNSTADGGLADLGGQQVCATKGSDSVARSPPPDPPEGGPGPVLDRLPGPAAAGPGGGDLHRRLDPGRAGRPGPVHQGRRAQR